MFPKPGCQLTTKACFCAFNPGLICRNQWWLKLFTTVELNISFFIFAKSPYCTSLLIVISGQFPTLEIMLNLEEQYSEIPGLMVNKMQSKCRGQGNLKNTGEYEVISLKGEGIFGG